MTALDASQRLRRAHHRYLIFPLFEGFPQQYILRTSIELILTPTFFEPPMTVLGQADPGFQTGTRIGFSGASRINLWHLQNLPSRPRS